MDQDHIDGLLERYLYLLHDYTSLREELTELQTGMYRNIARANFAAERGMRFGQDYYDDRMQACRRLYISCQSRGQTQSPSESQNRKSPAVLSGITTSFAVINPAATVKDSEADIEASNLNPPPSSETEAEAESVGQAAIKPTNIEAPSVPNPSSGTGIDAQRERNARAPVGECTDSPPPMAKNGTAASQKPNDPLRWFGLLAPMPLREAQAQGVRAVEQVIPRLASLNAEMAAVEIEVRRARKRRAKADAGGE
ncbi:hypothetical protein ANO14919_139130 [Xylariales sp. No.14919]|nr:hypothetical protein F5X98DRAFT_19667 [Xylaria grammica]GAW24329.1 hypothetical protein ANO14919_139130 [Xylariales sp. No.14919]